MLLSDTTQRVHDLIDSIDVLPDTSFTLYTGYILYSFLTFSAEVASPILCVQICDPRLKKAGGHGVEWSSMLGSYVCRW